MVRKGYILTELEASEVFLVLSTSRIKLQGKAQTLAKKYHEKLEKELLGEYEIKRS